MEIDGLEAAKPAGARRKKLVTEEGRGGTIDDWEERG